MPAIRPVTVDLATGVVTIGGTRVALERAGAYFTAPGGFRARALTFAERSSIVAGALIDPEPHRALLTKLRALAAPAHDTSSEMTDALILALAGGGEAAGAFADCALGACRKQGTDWQTVQQAPALLVDQVASEEASADVEAGWTRFEFSEGPQNSLSVEDCCRLMLEQLLERGTPHGESAGDAGNVGLKQSSAVPNEGDLLRAEDGNSRTGQVTDEIRQRPVAAWARAAQSPRVRAILPGATEAFQRPVQAEQKPAPLAGTLRSGSEWPKQSWSLSENADLDSREDIFAQASLPVPEKRTHRPPAASEATPKGTATLWDTLTASPVALASAAVAAAPGVPSPTAVSPKAGLRAHRLRDLPLRAAETAQALAPAEPSGQSAIATAPTMSEPVLITSAEPTIPQRDWLYEIATALADECDLRGLDA